MYEAVQAVGVAGLLRPAPMVDPLMLRQAQESALAQAYAQGVQDGEAAMLAGFASLTAEADAMHAAALGACGAAQQALADAFAESLCDLALAVARAVISAEPGVRAETVRSLLDEALGAAAEGACGTVFVTDAALQAASAAVPAGWTLAVDAELVPGAVRAVVDGFGFTASLERRLVQLATRLAEPS